MEKKPFTPGKWMGVSIYVVCLIILIGLSIGFVIQTMGSIEADITVNAIVTLASLLFITVWGAVFGSGALKTLKGKRE